MNRQTQAQLALQVRTTGPIDGFFYAYSKLLLETLQDLWDKDEVYVGGLSEAQNIQTRTRGGSSEIKELASTVASQLSINIKHPLREVGSLLTPSTLAGLIETAEKVLAIYEGGMTEIDEIANTPASDEDLDYTCTADIAIAIRKGKSGKSLDIAKDIMKMLKARYGFVPATKG